MVPRPSLRPIGLPVFGIENEHLAGIVGTVELAIQARIELLPTPISDLVPQLALLGDVGQQ